MRERERETERIWKWEVSRFALKAHFRIQPDSITIACQRMLKNDQTLCLFFHFVLVELVFSFCLFPLFLLLFSIRNRIRKWRGIFNRIHYRKTASTNQRRPFLTRLLSCGYIVFCCSLNQQTKRINRVVFFSPQFVEFYNVFAPANSSIDIVLLNAARFYIFLFFQPNLDGCVLCCVSSSCVSTSSRLALK